MKILFSRIGNTDRNCIKLTIRWQSSAEASRRRSPAAVRLGDAPHDAPPNSEQPAVRIRTNGGALTVDAKLVPPVHAVVKVTPLDGAVPKRVDNGV